MKIVKNSIVYLMSSLVSKGAPFLLLPFLTSYLPPSEFGELAIFLSLNTFYGAVIGMAMQANVTKNFFHRPKPELAVMIGNIFFILVASASFYFLATILIVLAYESLFSIRTKYMLLLPVLSFFLMGNQVHLAVLRNEGRAYTFAVFEITNAILIVLGTLVLLINFELGWVSQVISMLVVSLLLSSIGFFYLSKRGYFNLNFDKLVVIDILRLSIPLIPHVLGSAVISLSDRLIIEHLVGVESVAIYSIGYSFGMVLLLYTDAFVKAWSPWFYMKLAKPSIQNKILIVKSTYAYIASVFFVAVLVTVLFINLLPFVVNERYADASELIGWIALGYAIHGIYKIFFPYLVYMSKTIYLAASTVIAAIINVFFNFLLVQHYGMVGAAFATIIAYVVSTIIVFEFQRRNFPMPWRLKNIELKN